jgi:hypothetical protein
VLARARVGGGRLIDGWSILDCPGRREGSTSKAIYATRGPITEQVRQFGEWTAIELQTVMQRLFYEPRLTVIHHDFQAGNLLFAGLGLGATRRDRQADAGARSRWILPFCSAAG